MGAFPVRVPFVGRADPAGPADGKRKANHLGAQAGVIARPLAEPPAAGLAPVWISYTSIGWRQLRAARSGVKRAL